MAAPRLPGPNNHLPSPVQAPKPAKADPDRAHEWLSDPWSSSPSKTCRVCGVTERLDLVRADRKGLKYNYVDAHGVTMSSMNELPCPLYIGDVGGTLADTKVRVRRLDGHLDQTDDRVAKLEKRLEQLEGDNADLRQQIERGVEINLDGLVAWLQQMANLNAQAKLPTVPVRIAGLAYEVPKPVSDLLTRVSAVKVIDSESEDD